MDTRRDKPILMCKNDQAELRRIRPAFAAQRSPVVETTESLQIPRVIGSATSALPRLSVGQLSTMSL